MRADQHLAATDRCWRRSVFRHLRLQTAGNQHTTPFPIFDLGWTLNYEMFFYVLFATLIGLPARLALPAATIVLGGFVALGLVFPTQNPAIFVWTSPIILEFLCGIAISHARKRGLTLPLPVGLLMIGATALAVLIDPLGLVHPPNGVNVNNFSRLFGWGIPAAVIVAAAALSRTSSTSRLALAMAALGDASYSLYLTHPFVLIAFGKVATALKAATLTSQILMLTAILILSVCVAFAAHRFLDVPTGRWLSRLTASHDLKLTRSG